MTKGGLRPANCLTFAVSSSSHSKNVGTLTCLLVIPFALKETTITGHAQLRIGASEPIRTQRLATSLGATSIFKNINHRGEMAKAWKISIRHERCIPSPTIPYISLWSTKLRNVMARCRVIWWKTQKNLMRAGPVRSCGFSWFFGPTTAAACACRCRHDQGNGKCERPISIREAALP